MKIDNSRQSAVEAMDAFLSAAHQPDSLRVSKSGEVKVTNDVVTLFNRAVSKLRSTLDKDYKPTNWQARAREAVLDKLAKEVSMFSDGMRRDDRQILDKLVARISDPAQPGRPNSWRIRFTEEIAALKETHTADTLASALEKVDFFSQPGNRNLFPHVRKHLKDEASLPQALEKGLKSYLKQDRGLDEATADNGARTLKKVMISYGSNVHEAIDIAGNAGRMVIDGSIAGQHMPALPLAYLRVHHGLSLAKAREVYSEVHATGQHVAESRDAVQLMLTHDLHFDEADAIIQLAGSMATDPELQSLSAAQRTEIAWLRLHADKSPEEAPLISLMAGRLNGRMPVRRDALLAQAGSHLQRTINEAIAAALPAGWPNEWEALSDGSRRLTNTAAFKTDYLNFLQDSLKEGHIDSELGVASVFVQDAQRTHFRFGTGPSAVTLKPDENKALDQLTTFEPDPAIRQSLSRALFQAGGNGLAAAIHTSLAKAGQAPFSILSLDPDNDNQKASSRFWISVQRTDEGKLRVGYTMYFKHFTLEDLDRDHRIRINNRFDSSTPASETDHTARATAVIEFDPEQLRAGVIAPQLVREPELRLTIEPDIASVMRAMLANQLAKLS